MTAVRPCTQKHIAINPFKLGRICLQVLMDPTATINDGRVFHLSPEKLSSTVILVYQLQRKRLARPE